MVDAGGIVEGQAWASRRTDGRHFHPLVPLEVFALLVALVSPPPPPLLPGVEVSASGDETAVGPRLVTVGADCGQP